jgi:hypothetical protein
LAGPVTSAIGIVPILAHAPDGDALRR